MTAARSSSQLVLSCDAHRYLDVSCPRHFADSNRVGRGLRKIADLRRVAAAGAGWRFTRYGAPAGGWFPVDLCHEHAHLADRGRA